jgi:hypothetical protein
LIKQVGRVARGEPEREKSTCSSEDAKAQRKRKNLFGLSVLGARNFLEFILLANVSLIELQKNLPVGKAQLKIKVRLI